MGKQAKGVKTRLDGRAVENISKAMVWELRVKVWALGSGAVGRLAHGVETYVFGWFWSAYF